MRIYQESRKTEKLGNGSKYNPNNLHSTGMSRHTGWHRGKTPMVLPQSRGGFTEDSTIQSVLGYKRKSGATGTDVGVAA